MYVKKSPFTHLSFVFILLTMCPITRSVAREKAAAAGTIAAPETAVLWRDPVDIASRDLFYGPGGKEHVPQGTFTFDKEDLKGTNPKFVVRGEDGQKWKVKLGIEARPETVASRIVWAVGYYADEDYFVSGLHVNDMPEHLHRGQKMIGPDGSVPNARLKREDKKKTGIWRWRQDPFSGTRELNGLKVLMAVINNWDLKDVNNAVYKEDGRDVYYVSDLGASFGTPGRSWPPRKAKGDLDSYTRSKFIRRVTATTVDFEVPARPKFVYWVDPKGTWSRVHLGWIGRNIPLADARWMGHLLARLSANQIRDAFRAAGYSPEEANAFATVMERRIAALTNL